MSAPTAWPARMAVALVCALAVLVLAAGAAAAQEPPVTTTQPARARAPIPILTVADTTVERCGSITVRGRDFAPDVAMTVAVNGTTDDAAPVTDADGSFTFDTTVDCEQASGVVQIRASDATVTVAIDVAVGPDPDPVVAASASGGDADAGGRSELLRSGLRALLALVLAAELIVLWRFGVRRRARRSRPAEGTTPGAPARTV